MRTLVQKTEAFLEWGGIKKEITLLAISGVALVVSIFDLLPLPFDAAWVAIVLCGIPIVLEALIGLITAFDIKADVLVSLALIAAVLIGEDFAAGEVAFIMQLGALLEDVTVARARAGIEKLVHLTPQTARLLLGHASEHTQLHALALPGGQLPAHGGVQQPQGGFPLLLIGGAAGRRPAFLLGKYLPAQMVFCHDFSFPALRSKILAT